MKHMRSASQIMFGFLPEQTVDMSGKVWKVAKWVDPIYRTIDSESLKEELAKSAAPWAAKDLDGGFVQRMRGRGEVKILELNIENGVRVEPFPKVWRCGGCGRVEETDARPCECGARRWGQLPFVGFHDLCGGLFTPSIRRCPEHGQVRVNQPGTAKVQDLVFSCPVCNKVLRRGLIGPKCRCGKGTTDKERQLDFNVHRSSTVFSPRTFALVNPPSRDRMLEFVNSGGRGRALEWVLGGLEERNIAEGPATVGTLRQSLIKQGLPDRVVEEILERAVGHLRPDQGSSDLSTTQREEAEREAASIALALFDSRVLIQDLAEKSESHSERGLLYKIRYPSEMEKAGIESIELSEKFPVLTGTFGYTRGGVDPGRCFLQTYRDRHGHYLVYGNLAETEALFVRLDPLLVARWLENRGHDLGNPTDKRAARVAIARCTSIPRILDAVQSETVGSALLTLVHSMAHRFMRKAAYLSGIDQNALSEFLVPIHCGFFVYAVARGDFALGGLQAVLETDLHNLLHEIVSSEHRCPMDPGCLSAGGACMACLHVGEPSCRLFNRFLSRTTLWGSSGYFELTASARTVQ